MSTATVHSDSATEPSKPARSLRLRWSIIAGVLATAIFAQAVFAGLMLPGVDWGHRAHSLNAFVLIASTLAAGLSALVSLRRVPNGPKLGFTLLSLGVVLVIQTAVGKSSTEGANLMWVHIPLGVALFGFAMLGVARVRQLGGG